MATRSSMWDLHHRQAVSCEPIPKNAFLFCNYFLVVATEERIEEQHGDLDRGGGPLFIYFSFCAVVHLPDYDRWGESFCKTWKTLAV